MVKKRPPPEDDAPAPRPTSAKCREREWVYDSIRVSGLELIHERLRGCARHLEEIDALLPRLGPMQRLAVMLETERLFCGLGGMASALRAALGPAEPSGQEVPGG